MPAFRSPREIHLKHKFRVVVDGIESANFSKCSSLEYEVEKVEYREGGSLIPHKAAGLVNFTDITLERGTSSNLDFIQWALDTANAAGSEGGRGLVDPAYKRNLTINQTRPDNTTARGWHVYFAFPTKFMAGEWDNSTTDIVIESLTLTYDYFERAS